MQAIPAVASVVPAWLRAVLLASTGFVLVVAAWSLVAGILWQLRFWQWSREMDVLSGSDYVDSLHSAKLQSLPLMDAWLAVNLRLIPRRTFLHRWYQRYIVAMKERPRDLQRFFGEAALLQLPLVVASMFWAFTVMIALVFVLLSARPG